MGSDDRDGRVCPVESDVEGDCTAEVLPTNGLLFVPGIW